MKKLIPLFLALTLILTSCMGGEYKNVNDTPDESLPAPQSAEELYSLYSAIGAGMKKSELDALYGEPTPSYDDYGTITFYTYFNESKSAGVSVIFDIDDKLTTKTLYFNTKSNLIPFSGRYISEMVPEIKTDMSIATAIEIMGSTPLELSCQYGTDGPDSSKNIYCWYNEDGSNFMLHTDNGLVENVALYKS